MKLLGVAGLLLLYPALAGAQPIPLGEEFQVNSYTTDKQWFSAIARATDGDFVVVWASYGSGGNDTSYESIQGQRYAADGNPLGGEFQVNSYTTGSQTFPRVAMNADGDFVVVWGSWEEDGSEGGIRGRRFTATGVPIGDDFAVNTYTTGSQWAASISMSASGEFVVVWQSPGSTGSDTLCNSIQGQRFAANSLPMGGEFQVNSYTTGCQWMPTVEVGSDGAFVVTWESYGSPGSDSSDYSIQAQRFAADGNSLGGQFQVNSYTPAWQEYPRLSLHSDGSFVVVWESSEGYGGANATISGQRFAPNGNAVGSQFQIETYTTDAQRFPTVSMASDGQFIVVWQSDGSLGSDSLDTSIQAQLFAADGTAIGSEFQVNTYTAASQYWPEVAMDGAGDFVVVWNSVGSSGTDASDASIQGQRFLASHIFADGFESGDTSAWD